jgi:hypothetical protein
MTDHQGILASRLSSRVRCPECQSVCVVKVDDLRTGSGVFKDTFRTEITDEEVEGQAWHSEDDPRALDQTS